MTRDGYTAEEVRAALHSSTRKIAFRYELLTSANRHKAWLTSVESASVSHSAFAQINRTARFMIHEQGNVDIDWLVDRIKPWVYVEMDDGGHARFPQGVFLLTSPTRSWTGTTAVRDVEAYDPGQILVDDKVEDRYTILAGTNYIAAVRALLQGAGIQDLFLVPTGETLPADRDWEPGTEKGTIIGALLTAINYRGLWFNEEGQAVAEPYVAPQDRSTDYRYADDDESVIFPEVSAELDLFDVPNRWVIVVSQPDREPLSASYTNTSALSPTSTSARGRIITDFRTDDDASSQAVLDAKVERIGFESSQVYEKVEMSTALMPMHSHLDNLTIYFSRLSLDAKYSETGWEMELRPGGQMKHTIRRIVRITPTASTEAIGVVEIVEGPGIISVAGQNAADDFVDIIATGPAIIGVVGHDFSVVGGADVNVTGDYDDQVLADSPAGYWKLDETSGAIAFDQIAPTANGAYGDPGVGIPAGVAKLSTELDNNNGVTFELWVNPSLLYVGYPVGEAGPEDLAFYCTVPATTGWHVGVGGTTAANNTLNVLLETTTGMLSVSSSAVLGQADAWRHIAVTYDGANVRFYIDGVSAGVVAASRTLSFSNAGTGFLGEGLVNSRETSAARDVAVYPTALSAGRVLAHYNSGAGVVGPAVIGVAGQAFTIPNMGISAGAATIGVTGEAFGIPAFVDAGVAVVALAGGDFTVGTAEDIIAGPAALAVAGQDYTVTADGLVTATGPATLAVTGQSATVGLGAGASPGPAIIGVVGGTGTFVEGSYSSQVLTDSAFLYWRLNESSGTVADDASGNGRHGTYDGDPTLAAIGAITDEGNTGVIFNDEGGAIGTWNDSVHWSVTTGAYAGDFTAELWMNLDEDPAVATERGIVGAGGSVENGANGFAIRIKPTETYIGVKIPNSTFSGVGAQFTRTHTFVQGVWYHIVVTCDNTNKVAKIYVDGVQAGTDHTWVATTKAWDSDANIMAAGENQTATFRGSLDEVAIYQTALSAARVLAHYNAGIA